MIDGMSDSIQRSRIENLHSREVDHQSPTGLILSSGFSVFAKFAVRCFHFHIRKNKAKI